MAEIVISIAAKVSELLVVPIGKHICYPFKCKSNIEGLKKQVEKLTDVRDRVLHSVDEAKRQGDEIEKDVAKWLDSVDEFTQGVVKTIIDDEDNAKKRCFIGLCPNLMVRYSLSKKALKTTEDVVGLLGEGKFEKVSYRPPLQKTTSFFSRGYGDFDSRKPIFNNLMETLRNADVNLIGVYGMGGVGKTTLVKKVVAQAIEDKLFDVVAIAEVTETPDIKNIQGQIADELGLKFEEESLSGRAARLRDRLKKEKRVLLVLDNIWAKLDLEAVGIPLGEEEKISALQEEARKGRNDDQRLRKVLLTSRSVTVLSNDMNVENNFLINILSDEEAGNLFWKTVGDSAKKSDFDAIGIEIVRFCAGLPVAIATIASALKKKSPFDWKDALDQLRRSNPRHIKGMDAHVYSAIKLSYDFLESEEAKSLFLLCGLKTAGSDSSFDYLLRYCMGFGLFQNVCTLEQGRNRLHMLINHLKASCLLLEGNRSHDVKMHDIIHAVAVSIASTDRLMFNIQDVTDLKEMLEEKLPKNSTAISLIDKDVSMLPERLEYPKLKLFCLFMKEFSLQIPDTFFEGMKELKVLDLTKIHMLSLPSSLCKLTNIQTLCLDQCQLRNVAIIGELKRLEVLCLWGSDIEQLPTQIGQLTRLRLLELSNCFKLKVISPNVIASLTRLEELYMGNSFIRWEVEGQSNASLSELKQLPHLTTLDIHVLDAQIMPQDLLIFEKLERYRIVIGDAWEWPRNYEASRMLKLKLNNSIYLGNVGIKSLLSRTEDLYLNELKGVKNVLYELNGEGFLQLKHLHVQNALEIQYFINSIGWVLCNVFPKLESLFLNNLINLEKICHVQLATGSFNELKVVKVGKCDRLKQLFSFSMAKNLLQLQEIEITDCKNLEEIVFKEIDEQFQQNDKVSRIEFTLLRTLRLQCLPCLTSFGFKDFMPNTGSQEILVEDEIGGFMPSFCQNVLLPRLENLKLSSINIECMWLDQLPAMSSCCQTLTSLTLEECSGNLKFLFSYSMVKSLVLLEKLDIQNCKSIEGIINVEELRGEGRVVKIVFPKLINLQLEGLPNLTQFASGNLVEFPSLSQLSIHDCPKLKTFSSAVMSVDIKQSEKVEEMNCQDDIQPLFDQKVVLPTLASLNLSSICIQTIWHKQFQPVSSCFQKLTILIVDGCDTLKYLFSSYMVERLQNLEVLVVSNCKSVEVIFEELDLSSCMVEEIVADQENVKAVPKLVFPRLTLLKLADLPRLRVLYPGLHISEWPMLKTLRIWGCTKVEKLTSEFQSLQENHGEIQHQNFSIQQSLFIGYKVAFPNLEELSLEWNCIAKEMTNGNFLGNSCKLKVLQLIDASKEAALCPCFFLYKLPNLEKLQVFKGVLEEMFKCEGHGCKGKYMAEAPSKLNHLWLGGLNDSLNLGEENSLLCKIFQNLTTLEVLSCNELKTLVSSTVTFQNLTTLEVSKSGGLINLMAISTAKSLVQLARLKIIECKMIEEIIIHGGDREENPIIFSKLEYLELHCLPRLTSFYGGSYAIEFPSLQQIVVRQCPNMKIFSQRALNTPRLHNLQITEVQDDGFWEGSLNSTIQRMFKEMVGFHGMENLTLSEFPHLKEVWHNQFPVSFFSNLKSLAVDNDCSSLRYIFIPSMALDLVQLQELKIENCAILEAIMDIKELGRIDNTLFPNLNRLELKDLPKLSRFCNFAGNSIKLVCLTQLWIENCPNMETFIFDSINADMLASKENFHREIQPFFDEKVQIPNLKSLRINKMDNMRKIWHHQLAADSFSKIDSFEIYDCHNLLNVFPSNMLGRLRNLKELLVLNCKSVEVIFEELDLSSCMVEEIVADQENVKAVPKLVFPRLTSMGLVDLPRLRVLYPGLHISEWPMLKTLKIWGCTKVEKLTSEFQSLQENHGKIQHQNFSIQQPLFIVDKVAFPNLEELTLKWNYIAKEMPNGNFSGNSCKLKVLYLIDASKETALCPCFFLYKLPNLEELRVFNGVLEEMFICKGHGCNEKYMAEAPSKLNYLWLGGLNDSLNLGEENSLLCKIF